MRTTESISQCKVQPDYTLRIEPETDYNFQIQGTTKTWKSWRKELMSSIVLKRSSRKGNIHSHLSVAEIINLLEDLWRQTVTDTTPLYLCNKDKMDHLTIQEWSRLKGISVVTLKNRIKNGWDLQAAVNLPKHSNPVYSSKPLVTVHPLELPTMDQELREVA